MAVSEDQNQHETDNPIDESELEQYGVWVKAGPEDVDETAAEDEAFSLDDLSEDELTEAESDLLSEEEITPGESGPEDLDSFDLEDENLEDFSPIEEDLEEISIDDNEPLDSAELAISGDDLETPAEDLMELTLDDGSTESAEPEDELESLDLDLGDVGEVAGDEETELLTLDEEDLTIETGSDELGLDVSDDLALEPEPIQAEPVDGLDDLDTLGEDLELEDLSDSDVSVQATDSESSDGDGIIDESLNMDENLPDDLDDLTLDLDDLDVDSFEEAPPQEVAVVEDGLEEPDIIEPEDTDVGIEDLDLSALPDDGDDFLDLEQGEPAQADEGELPELVPDDELDLALDSTGDGEADDLLADLGTAAEREAAETHAESQQDRSLSLLESIERELASIRNELGDLKRELGELRGPTAPAAAPAQTDDEAAGGFFDTEDDDETIALTGAELDNIMNTAEFTEETGEPTEVEDLLGAPAEDLGEAGGVDEISLDEPVDESEPLEIDLDASDETFGGSADEVEALANLDIDAELADIDDLEDTTESIPDISESELPDLDLGMESDESDELVLDAEPLDAVPIDEPDTSGSAERAPVSPAAAQAAGPGGSGIPDNLKSEMRTVLGYLDQLLEALPEDKITEFAKSDHFAVYQRLFEELGLEQ